MTDAGFSPADVHEFRDLGQGPRRDAESRLVIACSSVLAGVRRVVSSGRGGRTSVRALQERSWPRSEGKHGQHGLDDPGDEEDALQR